MPRLILATRFSQLALAQARWVATHLCKLLPDLIIEFKLIKTTGDKILDMPLARIGEKGLFVKEIEEALLSGMADFAVHSMKDVPTELPPGLILAGISKREDPRDVLVSWEGFSFNQLPKGAIIGTSSLRRKSQMLAQRPDLNIVDLRGNVETRLRKINKEGLVGVVLAAAGLKRLGLKKIPYQILDEKIMLPAVGQGALGLECCANNQNVLKLLTNLNHPDTAVSITAERAFLAYLEGNCQVPIAGYAKVKKGIVIFKALVAKPDGTMLVQGEDISLPDEAAIMGQRVAKNILDKCNHEMLSHIYEKN